MELKVAGTTGEVVPVEDETAAADREAVRVGAVRAEVVDVEEMAAEATVEETVEVVMAEATAEEEMVVWMEA